MNASTIEEKFRWIMKVRFVAAFVMLMVFAGLRLSGALDFPFLLFAIAPVFEMFVNQPYRWLVRRVNNHEMFFFVNQIFDVLAITWGLHFAGGMNAYALMLTYPLVFIFSGTVLSAGRAYFMANFSFTCYAFLVWLEMTGAVSPLRAMHADIPDRVRLLNLIFALPLYNLIAFFVSFLSGQLRRSIEQERRLMESNEELESFASMVSHDLQEPLAKVIGFAELLEIEGRKHMDEPQKDYLGRMKNSAFRMQELIRGILEYSRVASVAPSMEILNVRDVISETVSDLEKRIEEEGGSVRLEMPDLKINANRIQIRRLFQNLVSNGLKYHKKGEIPAISVTGRQVNRRWVEVSVSDNGIGFDARDLEKIFKPFSRLHGGEEYQGTGIGLAVCERIVKRHGGSITARSQKGKGSTFVLRLPAAAQLEGA